MVLGDLRERSAVSQTLRGAGLPSALVHGLQSGYAAEAEKRSRR